MDGGKAPTSYAGNLVCLDEKFLEDRLHGEDLLSDVVLDEVNFAVGSPSNGSKDAEVALLHL